MSDPTVVVATFHHRHEAELARGFLTDAGIRAVVSADDGGGAFGAPLTFSRGSFARISVRSEDRERARIVLRNAGLLEEGPGEEESA